MPSGFRKTSGNHFEIYYEQPWGGVASNKAPSDIEENQLVVADGVTIRNGLLCFTQFAAQPSSFNLTLITPTAIPPYSPSAQGQYVNVAISQVIGLGPLVGGPLARNQNWTGRYYTCASTAGLSVGLSVTITGYANTNLNITDTVAGIVDSTHFFTYTPIAFLTLPNPDSTAASLQYYVPGSGGSAPPAQNWPNAQIILIFNCGNYLCAVDQYGFAYIATLQNNGSIQFQLDQTATNGPSTSWGTPSAVKVINGIAYIANYSTHTLYVYQPTVSYTVGTTYVAGSIIDIFGEYLIQLNTNSSSADGKQPTRINWSGPDKFTTWDPSVDRTAGYQSLTSVEDYISGFVGVDNVGYVFKRTGVTQITETGVAIQPFNYTTYWNSTIGQGLIFPNTLKQFGRFVFLATDSGIYSFYGGAFKEIGEPAKAAIYQSFNEQPVLSAISNALITAGINSYAFNDSIPLEQYVFIAATANILGDVIFWFYNPNDGTWTSLTQNLLTMLQQYASAEATEVITFTIQTASVFLNYVASPGNVSISNLPTLIVYFNFLFQNASEQSQQGTYVFFPIVNTPTANQTAIAGVTGNLNLLFRQEEIKLGYTRKPTIRRVVVKAYGNGTLTVNILGIDQNGAPTVISFGTITLDGTTNLRTYYTPSGVSTVEAPQLSITSTNFNGAIQKAMLAGTFADGDID